MLTVSVVLLILHLGEGQNPFQMGNETKALYHANNVAIGRFKMTTGKLSPG